MRRARTGSALCIQPTSSAFVRLWGPNNYPQQTEKLRPLPGHSSARSSLGPNSSTLSLERQAPQHCPSSGDSVARFLLDLGPPQGP